jgi:hypothetical protein
MYASAKTSQSWRNGSLLQSAIHAFKCTRTRIILGTGVIGETAPLTHPTSKKCGSILGMMRIGKLIMKYITTLRVESYHGIENITFHSARLPITRGTLACKFRFPQI